MLYTFNEPDAADRRRTQYFEMCGNRSIYHEGWTAVTRHGTPWQMVPQGLPSFADDVWELYDVSRDFSQADDLAQKHPAKLKELQAVFMKEGARNNVSCTSLLARKTRCGAAPPAPIMGPRNGTASAVLRCERRQ